MAKNQKTTDELVDKTIETMVKDFQTNPNPEAVARLREEYGVTFDITGELVEIREPKRLRKAIKAELEAKEEQDDSKLQDIAQSFTRGASKTGEVIAYALLDAPIEGAKTAKAVTGSVARNTASKMHAAHERRVDKAAERREARKERKAAREALKAEQELAEKKTELRSAKQDVKETQDN